MVGKAIKEILNGGSRRVIVPGCGTLLSRDSGELIFTEMLRTDDGQLVAKIAELENIPSDTARQLVESYGATLRQELSQNGRVTVEGVGLLLRTAAGRYVVENPTHDVPTPSDTTQLPPQEKSDPSLPVDVTPECVATPVPPTSAAPQEPVQPQTPQECLQASTAESVTDREEEPLHPQAACPAESAAPLAARHGKSRLRSALYGKREEEEDDEPLSRPATATEQASIPAARPDDDAPAPAATAPSTPAGPPSATPTDDPDTAFTPSIHIRRPGKPKKRPDTVLVIAIIALVITIGVLLYGYYVKRDIDAVKGGIVIDMADPAPQAPVTEE